ncbi:hypothetical protein D1632_00465 [Chryseobacterium nematophagum]|uniref:Uncharacterized protein n=1 Tax=Chryseobacterium nematophagum TaxID=2305228 RepID=A0A3M7LGK5_9FLAO|nr:hypothetical protein D1632_00525 [Chryseobacterium nematophagum]RMZ61257.1 hypothetical protein D1632_00140 [Chryseobacterium nematophagum]RMZ61319.1 hypothetical protein D1632_00465 [Chryseobacterium nematophagum]
MQISEILQFTFIFSLVLIPLLMSKLKKRQTFERKLMDLQHLYKDFFAEFPALNIRDKIKLQDQLLTLRKDNNFKNHKEAYRKLTNLIFKY